MQAIKEVKKQKISLIDKQIYMPNRSKKEANR